MRPDRSPKAAAFLCAVATALVVASPAFATGAAADSPATTATRQSAATSGSVTATLTPYGKLSDGTKFVLLAWSDVGMRTYSKDYSNVGLLAPGSNLYAQVVKRGSKPKPITTGFTVEYSFPGNTYSAGGTTERPLKSNFWSFVTQLFGVSPQPDTGLSGRGLSGRFTKKSGYFTATEIPLTETLDVDAGTSRRYPYQKARVIVRDAKTGREVAGLTVVTPVSTETQCVLCHGDSGPTSPFFTPTGDPWTNILALHDATIGSPRYAELGLQPLMNQRPVLCGKCHKSTGAGTAGDPRFKSLSQAIHQIHGFSTNVPQTNAGCLMCHPGSETRGLRDVHVTKLGYGCIECHGTMSTFATVPGRRPWLDEPSCAKSGCHKKMTVRKIGQRSALFHDSKGHGGIFCAACHDSAHATAKSRNANDRIKFLELQNDSSQLKKCTVCHTKSKPDGKTKVHGSAG